MISGNPWCRKWIQGMRICIHHKLKWKKLHRIFTLSFGIYWKWDHGAEWEILFIYLWGIGMQRIEIRCAQCARAKVHCKHCVFYVHEPHEHMQGVMNTSYYSYAIIHLSGWHLKSASTSLARTNLILIWIKNHFLILLDADESQLDSSSESCSNHMFNGQVRSETWMNQVSECRQ